MESPLSERELEIMRHVATGATNREIAQTLDIKHTTVKVHLRNIFEKLGAASRTEASLMVVREGWVELEGVFATSGEGEEEDAAEPEPPPISPPPLVAVAAAGTPPSPAIAPLAAAAPVRHLRLPTWLVALGAATLLALLALVVLLLLRQPSAAPSAALPLAEVRWQPLARLPEPRAGAGALLDGAGLLLVGGEGAAGVSDALWRYDPAVGRWDTLPPMPRPVRGAALALLGGTLYLIGGDEGGVPSRAVQRFDPATGRWALEAQALPVPLSEAAVAPFEGDLYLFGGWDGSAPQQNILRFRERDNRWEVVGALPSARRALAAATLPDGIVLVGGEGADGAPLDDVLHFDPRASGRLLSEAPLPAAVAAPRLVALGNALYLLGGGTLWERDPARQWQRLATPDGAPLPDAAALVASDPYLVVLGGQRAAAASDSVWQYQAIFRSFIPIIPGR